MQQNSKVIEVINLAKSQQKILVLNSAVASCVSSVAGNARCDHVTVPLRNSVPVLGVESRTCS